jgi:hypothetical protein
MARRQRIWDNARTFNGDGHPVTICAEKLEAAMERRMEEAVAAAAQELTLQQRAPRRSTAKPRLAGKGAAGGSKPREPGGVALLHASIDLAGSDSDDGEDGREAEPAEPRMVSSSRHYSVLM